MDPLRKTVKIKPKSRILLRDRLILLLVRPLLYLLDSILGKLVLDEVGEHEAHEARDRAAECPNLVTAPPEARTDEFAIIEQRNAE